ncbi:hypothetical protein [Alkalibacillus aidingensis]|uniref:hypothetical protein n=1 Tax=Alkalibacillus aidingensis TaxID=2747607 RepID=UPI0016616329|nr:hypothetical protein [Alkalibacillus aidingensis]
MLDVGQKIFSNHVVQLIVIFACFILAFIAQNLSINLSHIPLTQFISLSIDNIFAEEESFNIWLNVILPAIMYFGACLLFMWMGISNFLSFKQEDTTPSKVLRFLLAVSQVLLFGWFLFVGGKLLIYYAALSLVFLFLVAFFIWVFSSDSRSQSY